MANHSLSPRNKFAKRHYEAIALAMQDARFHLRNTALAQWECAVNCLADAFAATMASSSVNVSTEHANPEQMYGLGANSKASANAGLFSFNGEHSTMTIEITTASVVLARLRARQAVKRELQKAGIKVSNYSAREISSWAQRLP